MSKPNTNIVNSQKMKHLKYNKKKRLRMKTVGYLDDDITADGF